ncbi:hypothetical protein [Streptomyces sp. NPDC086838]|uniref:hypothetical protein n=1 Tax=Streptomyces sp. NPDC086838 TaxID=3365762 RepID=UPI0037F458D7
MSPKIPQEIGIYALNQALRYADQAASFANGGPNRTQEYAPLIATLGGLATVYADIAKAAAVTACNDA